MLPNDRPREEQALCESRLRLAEIHGRFFNRKPQSSVKLVKGAHAAKPSPAVLSRLGTAGNAAKHGFAARRASMSLRSGSVLERPFGVADMGSPFDDKDAKGRTSAEQAFAL